MLMLALSFMVIGALAYFVIKDTANYFVEKQADEVAMIVGTLAKTARSVYSKEVIGKLKNDGFGAVVDYEAHKGMVPIPAQYLKILGKETTEKTAHLFQYKPVSKWNIEPTQGLYNSFVEWAWPQLEAQDELEPMGPINWKSISRIEQIGDAKVMRFLIADSATGEGCVSCHNNYEITPDVINMRKKAGVPLGKQWKQHQLLGALEITIPLDRIEVLAGPQIRRATLWIAVILAGCLALIGGVYIFNSRQRRNIANLSWQANHDALTELINRRGFERSIHLMWQIAQQDRKEHALILLDLDGFKAINDTHGHQAGDEILKAVSKSISTDRRANDIVARLGGDEFAVLLPACPIERAYTIAEETRQRIEALSVDWNGHELKVGSSIGVTMINSNKQSVQQIIEEADAACYLAKKGGKNQVVVSEK